MRRNPPAKWVLPDVVNPPDRVCFMVSVPNNLYHIGAFRGALLALASAYKWQDDPTHKAKDVALVWRDVVDAVSIIDCQTQSAINGMELLEIMPLRIDCNCNVWVTCCDGTEKQLVTSDQLTAALHQPGSGATPPAPAPGASATACYTLLANQRLLMNYPVYAGDKVEVTSASGAGSDGITGALSPWACPDGSAFYFGLCGAPGVSRTADPLNTKAHMRLIWQINGVYYDAMAGPVTVPSGGPYQALLQVNDDNISDNSGSYDVCVKLTKAASTGTCKPADFTLNSGGWSIPTDMLGNPDAVWQAGIGYNSQDQKADNVPTYQRAVYVNILPSSVPLTSIEFTYNLTKGSYWHTNDLAVVIIINGTVVKSIQNSVANNGTGLKLEWTGTATATNVAIGVASSSQNSATFSGSCLITAVNVCYTGSVAPF